MMVTPGFSSWERIMPWIGAGPRKRGRREGCTFSVLNLGNSINSFSKILPKEATTKTSASSFFNSSIGRGSLAEFIFGYGGYVFHIFSLINEENAIQVIRFMLEDLGQKSRCSSFKRFAGFIVCSNDYLLAPFNLSIEIAHG